MKNDSPKNSNSQTIAFVLIIIAITFAAFLPSLFNGFTNYDDNLLITDNLQIRSISWHNIKHFFSSFQAYLYHPLVFLTYMAEYHFFKLNPLPYHLTNLLFHIGCGLLVFWMIFLLCKNKLVAFITALLFAVHPQRVESIAWVTERKDVLSTFFYLSALVSYLYYVKQKSFKLYMLVIFCYILSLLSKPTAVMLPFVVLLFDYFERRKFDKSMIVDKIPMFALALLFGIVALIGYYPEDNAAVPPYSLFTRFFMATYGILFYLGKLIYPVDLTFLYQYPNDINANLPFIYMISPAIVVFLILAVAYSARYTKIIMFGSLFFIITLLPVTQILPVGVSASPADRYMYIPCIGLIFIFAEGINWLFERESKYRDITRRFLIIFISGIVLIFSVLSWKQCSIWKDSVSLWSNFLKYYQNRICSFMAYHNRGLALADRGEYDKAIVDLKESLNHNPPDSSRVIASIGTVYRKKGDFKNALVQFNEAIKLNPRNINALLSRGNINNLLKEYDKAILDYNTILAIEPDHISAYYNRGLIFFDMGNMTSAMEDFDKALRINPNFAEAYMSRGRVYMHREQFNRAAEEFTNALRIKPDLIMAYRARAGAFFVLKEYRKAWNDIEMMQRLGYPPEPRFVKLVRDSLYKD